MRVGYITAGAAGMYCGACIHDNTLAAALMRRGVEVALVPTYTPLRTDEVDVSLKQVFYGGIGVFLEQKLPPFRRMPRFVDWALRRPALLQGVSRFSAATRAEDLGALTVSVLKGPEGHQRRELERLLEWLRTDFRPDIVLLTNSLFLGLAGRLKSVLGVPVLCAVQGEEIFLEALVEPYRSQALGLLRERAGDADGFVAPSTYAADLMAQYLEVERERFHVVPLGLHLPGHGAGEAAAPPSAETPFTIGFLARICPDKGLHVLAEGFARLAEERGTEAVRLLAAGWLGAGDRSYLRKVEETLRRAGFAARFEYRGELDRMQKIRFLRELHVLSVPAPFKEPKGLYVLEALANGVPVVQPDHGAFPELIAATGGGLLAAGATAEAVAAGIGRLIDDEALRQRLAARGREAVRERFNDDVMAAETHALLERFVPSRPSTYKEEIP